MFLFSTCCSACVINIYIELCVQLHCVRYSKRATNILTRDFLFKASNCCSMFQPVHRRRIISLCFLVMNSSVSVNIFIYREDSIQTAKIHRLIQISAICITHNTHFPVLQIGCFKSNCFLLISCQTNVFFPESSV